MNLDTQTRPINKISFCYLDPELIEAYSVVKIKTIEMYTKGVPTWHGLFDLRMGSTDSRWTCGTCHKNNHDCAGHFGHVELAAKIYVPHFLRAIHRTLQMVCVDCSHLLSWCTPEVEQELLGVKKHAARFIKAYARFKEKSTCPHCSRVQPKICKDLMGLYLDTDKNPLSANRAFEILANVSDHDASILGYTRASGSRPEWGIFSVLPIGPPCIRPSLFHEDQSRSENDITYKYLDILKSNFALEKELQAERSDAKHKRIILDRTLHLQQHVSTLMNNKRVGKNVLTSQGRNNSPFVCFTERLTSKTGRVRGNMMGKRVDFSARSVISPDPTLGIEQVGTPYEIATKLTVNEIVTKWNIQRLQQAVDNGPTTHPGALMITRNGERFNLNIMNASLMTPNLKPNVRQHIQHVLTLQIGDIVDRHLVDGDYVLFNRQPSLHKMSMMAHQVRVLPGKTFRINPNVCAPYNADFDGDEMNMHIPRSSSSRIELEELVAVPHQVMSPQSSRPVIGCIQDTLLGARLMSESDKPMNVSRAIQILARTKDCHYRISRLVSIAAKAKTILPHVLLSMAFPEHLNYTSGGVRIENGLLVPGPVPLSKIHLGAVAGSIVHILFCDYGPHETTRFINALSDIVMGWLEFEGFSVGISDTIPNLMTREWAIQMIQDSVDQANTPDIEEHDAINILNNSRNQIGSMVIGNVFRNNRIGKMVNTGSKGSVLNISQIMGIVGQQVVKTDGKMGRVTHLMGTHRAIPHVSQNDPDPKGRGFVSHCYLEGLDPIEYFCHSMSGREGLIDTAIKTSVTGYLQRKLIKSSEDMMVIGDRGMVVTANDQIVQFKYGGESFDAGSVERIIVPGGGGDQEVYMPCNPNRLLSQLAKRLPTTASDMTDQDVQDELTRWLPTIDQSPNSPIGHTLGSFLGPEHLRRVFNGRLPPRQEYMSLLDTIKIKFLGARVPAGECVGPLAAQSVGESLTQMMLNTFHSAGIASQTQFTTGIPRFNELINISKNPSMPVVRAKAALDLGRALTSADARNLIHTYMSEFISNIQVVYKPRHDPFVHTDSTHVPIPCIRVELKQDQMVRYHKYLYELVGIMGTACSKKKLNVYGSSDSMYREKPVPVMIIESSGVYKHGDYRELIHFAKTIPNIYVCGYSSVRESSLQQGDIHIIGGNLADILSNPIFDSVSTVSNHIVDTYHCLGIEAARELLFRELSLVLEDSGIHINPCHIDLLVDIMTHKSILISMDRHGIKKSDASVLSGCSFEETVDQLAKAATWAETDYLNGISPSIMLGQAGKLGTNVHKIGIKF